MIISKWVIRFSIAPCSTDGVMDIIRGLANADNNVLVVVDNVHDSKMVSIFYVIDQLQSFNKIDKVRFLLAARQPEYDTLLSTGIFRETVRKHRDSISSFKSDLYYEIPYLTINEIRGFIVKYQSYLDVETEGKKKKVKKFIRDQPEQEAIGIFEDTKGYPIMVKFAVVGEGMRDSIINNLEDIIQWFIVILVVISILPTFANLN